jgi:hypothetical protein
MKTLKAICTAAALSVPAHAGDMQTPRFIASPPESNITGDMSVLTATSSALGDMSTPRLRGYSLGSGLDFLRTQETAPKK